MRKSRGYYIIILSYIARIEFCNCDPRVLHEISRVAQLQPKY